MICPFCNTRVKDEKSLSLHLLNWHDDIFRNSDPLAGGIWRCLCGETVYGPCTLTLHIDETGDFSSHIALATIGNL